MRLSAPSVLFALTVTLCLGACATGHSERVRLVSACLGPLPLSAEFLSGYDEALTAAREDLEPRHAEALEEGAALWLAERDRARACGRNRRIAVTSLVRRLAGRKSARPASSHSGTKIGHALKPNVLA